MYNVVDDDPAPRSEVTAFALAELGLKLDSEETLREPLPSTEDPRPGTLKSRFLEEKRVSNKKLLQTFGGLQHPTYKSGIQAIIRGDETPFRLR